MKITIEAETPEEKSQLSEPWVRSGIQRMGLAGRMDPKQCEAEFEFGFIHGPWQQVKTELSRLIIDGDTSMNQQLMINSVLQAHNVIAQQIETRQIGAQLFNRNGLKIHQP